MNWTEIITALVAIYGAVLSTYTLFTQLREKKARVSVAISVGFLTSPLGTSGTMIFLSASNPGQKSVTLSTQGFIIPHGKQLVIPLPNSNVVFPYELLPEKNCQIWVEPKEIVRGLKSEGFSGKVKLIGFYRDQIGRTYRSRPYDFDIDQWFEQDSKTSSTHPSHMTKK